MVAALGTSMQDHGTALGRQCVDAVGARLRDQVLDGFGRAVPEHAAVHDGLRQRPEVISNPLFAHGRGLVRKAQFQIATHDVGAGPGQAGGQPTQDSADALARRRLDAAEPFQQGDQRARFRFVHGVVGVRPGYLGRRGFQGAAGGAVPAAGAAGAPRGVL
ncbi:hypothetical protein G6F65_019047 [Rhizopus arrhizus]|nr:hypothetical protein G6F65_019047 [Rhizopus arrhizus]